MPRYNEGMADTSYHKPTTISEALNNRRYHGKIVVASGGEVHGTKDPEKAVELLKKLEKKYPQEDPQTTVIPKGGLVTLPQLIVTP